MDDLAPKSPKKSSPLRVIGFVFLGIASLWIIIGVIGNLTHDNTNSSETYREPRTSGITGNGTCLYIPGSQYVEVAVSEAACNLMLDAFNNHDEERLKDLLLNGLMFPADNRSSVLVLESGLSMSKIRIISGNQNGEIGYVPTGWLSGH